MKKILSVIYSFFLFLISFNIIYAEDLRDFSVGLSVEGVPERGYVNLRCKDKTEILKWSSFKKCQKLTNFKVLYGNWSKLAYQIVFRFNLA